MIILSMLGTGNYQSTQYRWGERICDTHLPQAALASWFPEAAIKVLATAEAAARHGEVLCAAIPRAELVSIPSGASTDELWEMFNAVAQTLPNGSEVILDITHGFRSLPALTLLALSFLQTAREIELRDVVYGAWEARSADNVTPIFELTPFVKLLKWANATDRFVKTGDARAFTPLLSTDRKAPLWPVSESLMNMSEGLLAGRQQEVRTEANALFVSLREALSSGHFAGPSLPYGLLAARIEETYGPLQLDKGETPESALKATWQLVKWYVGNGHYIHAATLAREWCVSVRCWKAGADLTDIKERGKHEHWLGAAATMRRSKDEATIAPAWDAFVKQWDAVQDLRNDLAHYKDKSGAKSVRKNVTSLPEKLRVAVEPLGLVVGP